MKLIGSATSSSNVGSSTIYIPTFGMSTLSITISKSHYCIFNIYDSSGTKLNSSSVAGTVNKTYDYDVSNFDYIKITAQPNGVGNLATLTIKNISATK